MSRIQAITSAPPVWIIAMFAILFLFPLVELPRPALITTPPWKIELVVSLFILAVLPFARKVLSHADLNGSDRSFAVLLGAFAIWSGVSVFWAESFGSVVHHTLAWAVYLVIFLVAVSLLRSRGVGPVFSFAAILTSILAVLCILDFVTVVDFTASEGTLRIRWAKYAELLVTVLPFIWAAAFYSRGRRFAIVLLIGIGGWIAAMLSLSKAAFISGVIGFGILFVLAAVVCPRRHRMTAVKLAAVWLVLTAGFQIGSAYLTTVPATTQYISGTADATRSTSTMRVFTWSVTASMIRESPVLGVGADNFGTAFNEGRKAYAAANPDDANNAIGEDYLFERAHNEYLQIAAELGIVGFLVFSAAFLVLGLLILRSLHRNFGKVDPLALGAIAGMCAFAVSSLFTSFSFRAFQNGAAFFAMAAAAVYLLGRKQGRRKSVDSGKGFRILSVVSLSGLLLFSALAGISQVLATLAERQATAEDAEAYLARALKAYPENGGAQFSFASLKAGPEKYGEAADLTRASITNGTGASIVYARLSEYEEKTGNSDAAVQALREGIAVFPRSSYLRASLVLLLERIGETSAAESEMNQAREIDPKQANGWYALIKLGSKDAYQLSRRDPNVAGPAELSPQSAVYQYLNESTGR